MVEDIKRQNTKIKRLLDKFSFPKNSIFFIHSDITNYNVHSKNWSEKCKNLYGFFSEYFKDSTIAVPTFTYSFCRNKYFDLQNSPSEVGIFTEYFRNQKNVLRSSHPIFSIAAKGKNSNLLTTNLSNSSTGNGSIFEKLKVFDAYIIFFGSGFIESCTFLHYIEQCNKVNYRYSKYFEGKIRIKNRTFKDKWEFYVRNTELYKFKEWKKYPLIEKDLKKKRLLVEKKVSNLKVSYCSARKIFKFISKKLKKNENYITGSKPIKL